MSANNSGFVVGNISTGGEGEGIEVNHVGENDRAVANIDLAVNRNDEATFVPVAVWGPAAESLAENLGEGDKIAVDGELTKDVWEDEESGENRSQIGVVVGSDVGNIEYLDSGSSASKASFRTIGRLGSDPEKVSGDDAETTAAEISVGVSRPGQDDDVTWFTQTVFGPSADFLLEYADKGDKIMTDGNLDQENWEGGQKLTLKANSAQSLQGASNDQEQEADSGTDEESGSEQDTGASQPAF